MGKQITVVENRQICTNCNIEKDLNKFTKCKRYKSGFSSKCKECSSTIYKQRYRNVERSKNYYELHKDQIKKRAADWNRENRKNPKIKIPEIVDNIKIIDRNPLEKQCIHCKIIKKIEDFHKDYRIENNRGNVCKKCKYIQRLSDKRNSDPCYKLHSSVRIQIRQGLEKNKGKKQCSILLYLPYTFLELKEHLEKQWEYWMNWENYGPLSSKRKTWQIDHIYPQSLLPYDSMSHPNFIECWKLDNLRPLTAIENVKKGNKVCHMFS